MAVYSVHSEHANPALHAAVVRHFAGAHYIYSDTLSFVSSVETAREVSIKLGIKTRGEDGSALSGIEQAFVLQASPGYFGWTKTSLWEWLKNALETNG